MITATPRRSARISARLRTSAIRTRRAAADALNRPALLLTLLFLLGLLALIMLMPDVVTVGCAAPAPDPVLIADPADCVMFCTASTDAAPATHV
ncbi:hypothetical protein, partial [Actinoplanes sp. GCM10030250]|uniref:hypothetical protein n=1 Tax=Actinoplanes sp. GCM10030250 TaxID=3273376 RepID=UPI00362171C4